MATRNKPRSKRKRQIEARNKKQERNILFVIIGATIVLLILLYMGFSSVVR